jgi:hypothetical protein
LVLLLRGGVFVPSVKDVAQGDDIWLKPLLIQGSIEGVAFDSDGHRLGISVMSLVV